MPFFGDEYTMLQALDEIKKANSWLDQAFFATSQHGLRDLEGTLGREHDLIRAMEERMNSFRDSLMKGGAVGTAGWYLMSGAEEAARPEAIVQSIALKENLSKDMHRQLFSMVDGAKNRQEAALMVDSMYQSGFAVREILTNLEGFSKYGSIMVQSSSPQAYGEQVKAAIGSDIFGSFLTEPPRAIPNQQSPMYQALKTAKLAGPNGPVTAGGQLTDPLELLKGLEYGLREETESQKAKVYSDLFQDNLKVTNSLVEGVNSVLGNPGVTTALGTALRFGSSFMGPIGWGILAVGATPGKLPGPVTKMPFGLLAHGAQNNISLEEQKPPEVHITNNVYVTTSGDNGHRIGEDVFRALGEKMRADLIRSGSHLYKY